MDSFPDRLLDACRQKGSPICVGIDPVLSRLPKVLRPEWVGKPDAGEHAGEAIACIRTFVRGVLNAVAPHAPCVKFQSACFERYLWPGVKAYHELMEEAKGLGLVVIADAKRGDIGISAEHYAAGCLGDTHFRDLASPKGPDALTINAYLGADSLQPFIDLAIKERKGLFALVRTSNPGGDALQSMQLADGRCVSDTVAQIVATAGGKPAALGQCGYSLLGAVVGATKPVDAARLRELMPEQIFLVPGFGAQGGSAQDVKACFKANGTGAIITASRSVLFAYEKPMTTDWTGAIEAAAVDMKKQIAAILPE